MDFKESEKINVTDHMEKKGRFTYLSWPFAVSEFRKAYPNGTWRIIQCENGSPYYKDDSGCYVSVTVIPDTGNQAVQFSQVHPVLDNKNNTIKEPNAFQVNTSIQRCLVKAIAIATGIGLHIYAGEDLPPGDEEPEKNNIDKAAAAKYEKKAAAGQESMIEGNINDYVAQGIAAIMKDHTPAEWWAEFKERVIADCGIDGAKIVHKKVVK